jgi:pyridoxamine 5'-phosphate oxidase
MENLKDYINKLRIDFSKGALSETDVEGDPILQFEKWFKQAVEAQVNEPNAFVLASAGKDGRPSARVVLLRNFDTKGFVFYSNYTSRKGVQLNESPYGAITFFWPELERQVRLEGSLEKQEAAESDAYFSSRPRASQLGAWVSAQSTVIAGRKQLDEKYLELEKKFPAEVPRPPYWGGYLLKPDRIEFWQGRASRLHDRLQYRLEKGKWVLERLAP